MEIKVNNLSRRSAFDLGTFIPAFMRIEDQPEGIQQQLSAYHARLVSKSPGAAEVNKFVISNNETDLYRNFDEAPFLP